MKWNGPSGRMHWSQPNETHFRYKKEIIKWAETESPVRLNSHRQTAKQNDCHIISNVADTKPHRTKLREINKINNNCQQSEKGWTRVADDTWYPRLQNNSWFDYDVDACWCRTHISMFGRIFRPSTGNDDNDDENPRQWWPIPAASWSWQRSVRMCICKG